MFMLLVSQQKVGAKRKEDTTKTARKEEKETLQGLSFDIT